VKTLIYNISSCQLSHPDKVKNPDQFLCTQRHYTLQSYRPTLYTYAAWHNNGWP